MNADKIRKKAFEGVSKENVHGTTPFVAPERQKEGTPEPSSAKSDIWSLGCVVSSIVENLWGGEKKKSVF